MVRQALASAIPPERKTASAEQSELGAGEGVHRRDFADADEQAPRKQRHTAHRIWQRIGQEHPEASVAEATVRRYVRRRKQELGQARRETFVPQSLRLGRRRRRWIGTRRWSSWRARRAEVHFFAMRSMASGGAFHVAYYHATQQAFLEAHELAFRYFGGVFRLLRYDNLKSAVKKILRGHQREETERLIAFRSHWGFQTEFCNPARGNEKGGVEGEVGYFRRNHLVPVPGVQDLAELNAYVAAAAASRTSSGRSRARRCRWAKRWASSANICCRWRREGFELAETSFPMVDGKGCVKVRTNWYSTPLRPGTQRQARLLPAYVEIWHERQLRGAARAQLRALSAGAGSGALSGRAGEQAGCAGGIAAVAAVARARALAGELRSVVAELAATRRASRRARGR